MNSTNTNELVKYKLTKTDAKHSSIRGERGYVHIITIISVYLYICVCVRCAFSSFSFKFNFNSIRSYSCICVCGVGWHVMVRFINVNVNIRRQYIYIHILTAPKSTWCAHQQQLILSFQFTPRPTMTYSPIDSKSRVWIS